MNNKLVGAILLGVAGLIVAIGAVGSQIALAICAMGKGNIVPPGPESAGLHSAIMIAAVALSAVGLFSLFRKAQ